MVETVGPTKTEQFRKLDRLRSYNLDQFYQKESSCAASKKVQNTVSVGTVERGLSPYKVCIPWELSAHKVELSICTKVLHV
jgi:hypothetical protein